MYTVYSHPFSEDEDFSADSDGETRAYHSRKRDRDVEGMLDTNGNLLSKRICASTATQEYGGEPLSGKT